MKDILKLAEKEAKYGNQWIMKLSVVEILGIYNQAIEDAADKLDRMNGTNCGDDIRNLKKDVT